MKMDLSFLYLHMFLVWCNMGYVTSFRGRMSDSDLFSHSLVMFVLAGFCLRRWWKRDD